MTSHRTAFRSRRTALLLATPTLAIALLAAATHVDATPADPSAAAAGHTVDTGGALLPHRAATPAAATSGYLGVTFGMDTDTLNGNHQNQGNTIYNLPLYKSTGDLNAFWDDYVEELVSAGVDFVAVDVRGYVPGTAQPNGGGDPRILTGLVDAINRRGVANQLKIAAFDDTPASLTDKKNQIVHHTGGYTPLFDIGDANGTGEGGYQYIWDRNLRPFYAAVPDSMRFKVDGRPLVYEWSINDFAFTNQGNGNAARMLGYVRSHAQSEFGVDPYIVVDNSWLSQDPTVSSQIGGADGWFGVPGTGRSLTTFNGSTYGVAVPGFHFAVGSTTMDIDPDHGQTLAANLAATAGAGAKVTLVEGFTDWQENAALTRTADGSYDQRHTDYPGQMINIMRRYSRTPFPTTLRVEAEAADSYSDTTAGNQWNVYRDGNLDIQTTPDSGGGWNVGAIAGGEWLQWQEQPLQGSTTFHVRAASTNNSGQLRFVVDGQAGPTTTVPNTGDWQTYQTIDAGTFTFAPGTYHTVRIEFLTGNVNLNYWTATHN
ncbi:Carbohydrate binding module (family 6) [Streptomyces sp. DvalAA-14]|uniref:DUF5010 domain-containing protein n=1 Tax=unclassified Streptomyces TaxID=2593676 RepID=UPI00081B5B81|nr:MULTISPECIES: DUF5010 domain-containing protein [unclassified Streptomyces]MYS18680.1 DUF5010 domain-containing protein [Streptomyces sp. SID4948]SCD27490.1 Carbohydrate binding module (family 6) [Streptomyces sp. DvalAA-14]